MPGQPLTADEERELTRLHAEGLSMRKVAKEMDRSLSSVQRVSRRLGLTWDHSSTAAATAAKQIDNRARRAALETLLLENAEHLAQQVRLPHEYIDHGGKDFIEVRWVQDEPTPTDKLKLMQAVGIGIDRSIRIAEFDADAGTATVRSMLLGLAEALGVRTPQ